MKLDTNLFLCRLCKIAANLFMLEEIIKQTLFVLIYGITNTIIRIIALPFNYLISALIGIAKWADEQGKHHCEELQDLYKGLLKTKEDADNE